MLPPFGVNSPGRLLKRESQDHKFNLENAKKFCHTETRDTDENFWKHGNPRQIRPTGASNWIQFTQLYVHLNRNTQGGPNIGFTNEETTNWSESNQIRTKRTKIIFNIDQTTTDKEDKDHFQHRPDYDGEGCQAQRSRGHRRLRRRDNRTTNGSSRPNK
ncbi:hypothetical protein T265_07483 [Opisthorchis viverrini]|uniref:Uncharacterized protein n=1 Tax=Opisthorchis viverrini TaxID=6198 RepID=A0A074ZH17_OPIVI|nr:hypothetical protein T265_07483 [Opisthorchis viverrini]KER24977.1 hypothetical protein T265_07483 [Opisthorchis viverrini]